MYHSIFPRHGREERLACGAAVPSALYAEAEASWDFQNKHAAFGKFQRTMKPALCPLCPHQICMYVFVLHEIIIKMRLVVGRRTKTLLTPWWATGYLMICLCVCASLLCVCVCVRLAGCGCLLAGNSNSCYWDFLRQHVNKRKALEPASACPPANESRAPGWIHPMARRRGGVTRLHGGGGVGGAGGGKRMEVGRREEKKKRQ